jgi:hypothetical protein
VPDIRSHEQQLGAAPGETPSLLPMLIGGLVLITIGMIGVAVFV